MPSKTVLILLFLLASEEERSAILEAIGDVNESLLTSRYGNAEDSLKKFLAGRHSPSNLNRVEFAEESAAIVASKEPIESVLVELLKLFRSHAGNRKLLQALIHMLPYFEFVGTQTGSTNKSTDHLPRADLTIQKGANFPQEASSHRVR